MSKILVIEDDTNIRTLLLRLLQMEGFEALGAINGRSGIELAQYQEPDLIICDIMMPECNGYEVLAQLQDSPSTASIPFIFLSAKADRTDQRHGMNLGADDYITKPFTKDELLNAVSARLAKRTTITQPYVNAMKQAVQSLNQLAYQDRLTNLPNRIFLHQYLQETMALAKDTQSQIALLDINLNHFKAIHDNQGHTGDAALCQLIADRLVTVAGEQTIVARLGENEFAIVLTCLADLTTAETLAKQLLQIFLEPLTARGRLVDVQVNIGIAIYPDHATTPDQLLNRANLAMNYGAGRRDNGSGNTCYQVYTPQIEALITEQQLLTNHLPVALERSQLVLFFQPQVNSVTGRVIGVEALLRWHHPELGILRPHEFISIAEKTGLILPIGEWVIKTVCEQAVQWGQFSLRSIKMSVNISVRQFRQGNLLEILACSLHETGLAPQNLVLELTESSVMEESDLTIKTLQDLKGLGIQIAIDNFGTSYFSLQQLKRLPIDILKIDRSFVRDITENSNNMAIVKAIIAMAQTLQLKVIAQGVETREQQNFLRQAGCYAMQGFLFSPPIPLADLEQFLTCDLRL